MSDKSDRVTFSGDNNSGKLDALLSLTETGGTLTADGTEQNIYLNNSPSGLYEPRCILIDLDNMAAADGDEIEIKVSYRIKPGGDLKLLDYKSYSGDDGGLANGRKLIEIDLWPNRFGVQVTLKQTAGVNKDYDCEVFTKE